jgi:hypothetical protein
MCICLRPWLNSAFLYEIFAPFGKQGNEPQMDTDAHESESDLTRAVIGAAFEISKVLAAGFLEKVYERALIRELALRGLATKAQVSTLPTNI